MLRKNLRQRVKDYKEALRYFVIGILFFVISYTRPVESSSFFSRILSDGLFVGGWLFIWETFSDLFIKSHKLMEDRRIVQRFKRAEIQFVQRV